ncbi:hypothetical protein [Sphingobium sp. UBA5915]|mgnify:CR=1 FL=1|uniref:hypothetical protein n=1 Tax=Sphingobium sp. UBA5915 TaxID=1947530 RepID=UPI0025CC509C|nr:hypothetical protein [Sphingobium sp. UBA5915]
MSSYFVVRNREQGDEWSEGNEWVDVGQGTRYVSKREADDTADLVDGVTVAMQEEEEESNSEVDNGIRYKAVRQIIEYYDEDEGWVKEGGTLYGSEEEAIREAKPSADEEFVYAQEVALYDDDEED